MRNIIRVSNIRIASVLLPAAMLCTACGASASSGLGTFKVNDKAASLTSAVMVGMNPTNNVPRMVLVLSEKAPPAGTNANETMMADPNAFGASVSVTLLKMEGEGWSNVTGCMLFHPATKNEHGDFLDAKACVLSDVSVANGEFHARLTTPPSTTYQKDAIQLDVKFAAKMP